MQKCPEYAAAYLALNLGACSLHDAGKYHACEASFLLSSTLSARVLKPSREHAPFMLKRWKFLSVANCMGGLRLIRACAVVQAYSDVQSQINIRP